MKTGSDRSGLQEALADENATLLLFFGEPNSVVSKLHAKAETIELDPDWRLIWVSDLGILNAEEKANWYRDDGQFTTLSTPGEGSKRAVKTGKIGDLCQTSGELAPSALRSAFTGAEC